MRPGVLAGLALIVLGCHDEAEREYLAYLRGDEDGSTNEERVAHLERALALEPGRAWYWESRAILRIDGRDFPSARADLDRAIERADRPYLRFLRGLVLCQSGDCAAALPDFDRAIADQPENAQFYRGRALALVAVGRPANALVDADLLVRLDPQHGPAYNARGAALAALGRHGEAIRDFDEAVRRMAEAVYPLRSRAASHEALGNAAKARADREAAAVRAKERAGCAYCLDPFRY
jgi:tetratricopeptide (TPR) repeat protein